MKNIIALFCAVLTVSLLSAQTSVTIALDPPVMDRGTSVMKALSLRASAAEFDTADIGIQELSHLLWAANGINRPESGKRTAPSAINAQDIDIYVFIKAGVYIYDAKKHSLCLIISNDHRNLIADRQAFVAKAPVILLLVSDISRFKFDNDSLKMIWAAEDAGIVSQNISIFCASAGLATRPRYFMNRQKLRELLNLKDSQHLMLNNPVSYKKKQGN
jgi:SagB-type dehydrogenase family enzyme